MMNRFFPLFLFLALLPLPALAHEGTPIGFLAGLKHPVLGLDHLLAMVSVGIVSAQMGGRAIWSVPLAFVTLMAVGGVIGLNNEQFLGLEIGILLIEQGIMISVIALGLAIAFARNMPVIIVMAATAFFGFFHGYAHGIEIPDLSLSRTYIAGFLLSTALLHILGVGIGEIAARAPHGKAFLRYVGAAVAGAGLHMEYQAIMFEMEF